MVYEMKYLAGIVFDTSDCMCWWGILHVLIAFQLSLLLANFLLEHFVPIHCRWWMLYVQVLWTFASICHVFQIYSASFCYYLYVILLNNPRPYEKSPRFSASQFQFTLQAYDQNTHRLCWGLSTLLDHSWWHLWGNQSWLPKIWNPKKAETSVYL